MSLLNGGIGEAYSVLSKYYESLAEEDGYEEWGKRVLKLAEKYAKGKKCADLACGSGYFTRLLKKAGYDVFGCDISSEMLTEAEKKSADENLYIEYRKQDISAFKSFEKLDLVTVINDGFNYLGRDKLKRALKAISKNLKSGGALIFDVSSEYKIKNILANNVFAEDLDDLTLLWFNELVENKLTMSLTLFIKDGEKYVRKDEIHVQYAHSVEFIENALREVGLTPVEIFGKAENGVSENDERINFVAIKE
ncbi:MAG: methyltransferase domain-containing protein [Clostridiales bacterium]|nr:methyltransferase domain-containing protein [Clostridiales bacterium]